MEEVPSLAEAQPSKLSLRFVWRALVKRRFLLLLVTILGVAAGIFLYTRPSEYTALSQLEIRPGASQRFDISQLSSGNMASGTDEKIGTDVLILQSRTLMMAVARSLKLNEQPEFFGVAKLRRPYSFSSAADREAIIRQFARVLTVDRVPKTDVVTLSANTRSQQLSASIVNTLMNEYIDSMFKTRYASTARAAGWLTTQIDDLKRQVESDQVRLVELQKRLGMVGIDPSKSLSITAVEGLTQAATEASIERIVAETRYRVLEETDPALLEGGSSTVGSRTTGNAGGTLLSTLRSTQAQLSAQLAELKTQFGPNFQQVKQTQAQLDATNAAITIEEKRIVGQAQSAYKTAQSNESMTETRLATERAKAFSQHNDLVEFNLLQQDYASHRTLYQGLIQRLREAGITAGLESSEVDVIDFADIPVRPSGRSAALKLAASILFAFAFGVVFVILLESIGSKITDASQVEATTGLPLFGLLPAIGGRGPGSAQSVLAESGVPVVMAQYPNSIFAESIRTLRSTMLLSVPRDQRRSFLFTSSGPGEGKTTISSNLSYAFASAGASVLLIDGDMRRPRAHASLKLKNLTGLSTYLSTNTEWRDTLQNVPGVENLHVITAGPIPPLAAELLESPRMSQLVDEAAKEYDIVLIDAPPAANLVDATLLGRLTSVSIFVVRFDLVSSRQLFRALEQMQRGGVKPKGFVFNAVEQGSTDYDDYYYYGSKYYTSNEK